MRKNSSRSAKFTQKLLCYIISNHNESVLLWDQSLGSKNGNFVIWDYHVILVYFDRHNGIALVFDFDSILPFPCDFEKYQCSVFKAQDKLFEKYCSLFRVVDAYEYLYTFASDRTRMKNEKHEFIKPPPNYPCIRTDTEINNLNSFISMDSKSFSIGEVCTFDEFRRRFSLSQ
uniref:Protein N-terminal glutamine amidohydrolase n=1 Tax=Sarcoptes scabiei TaxID=52283 RepID=A0A834R820_SARSC